MTGCDHNWFLKDVEKSSHRKSSEARVLLHECGDMLPIPAHLLKNLKTFVIKYVYGSKELGCSGTVATQ